MLDQSIENYLVSREDLLASRELPNPKAAGLSNIEYQKLVSDPKSNRLAVNTVIDEYLDYFYNLTELGNLIQKLHEKEMLDPDVLSGLKPPPQEEDEPESDTETKDDDLPENHWSDSDILQKLVDGTRNLLDGQITPENVYCARTLITACFNDALEAIADQKELLSEIKNGDLGFEDDTEEDIQGYIDSANRIIKEESGLVEKSLQANHYISQLFISKSSQ